MLPPQVLLVDDVETIRIMLAAALRSRGISSMQAADGAEALELLRSHRFEVMVLDLMMPKVSGLEVLSAMQRCSIPQPHFIFVLTAASEQWIEELDASLVQGVLKKPFDIALFGEVIEALIRREPGATSEVRRSGEQELL